MGYSRTIGTGIPRLLMRPSRTIRARLAFVALLAFGLRALIPVGFMPSSDGSLSLMICPGGLPAGLLPDTSMSDSGGMQMSGGMQVPAAHQHPGHSLLDEGYCAFTTGFSSAPPPLLLAAALLLLSFVAVVSSMVLPPSGIRLVHLPQARAPPAPL